MNARLIIAITLTLTLAACSGVSGIMRNSQGTSDFNPHQGSQGLEIRFVPDNPPTTLYDTKGPDSFPLLIEVWNKGAQDLGPVGSGGLSLEGYLIISGYDDSLITGTRRVVEIQPIVGKSAYNSIGGYKILDMGCNAVGGCQNPSSALALTPGMSEYPVNLQATVCYEYRTEASPTVCIDGNPYTGVEDKPCQVGQVTGSGSQGAPVAVSNIEEIAMPGSVQFRIHVSNVGRGKVVARNTVQDPRFGGGTSLCPTNLGFEDLNIVDYTVRFQTILGAEHCEPQTPLRLVDGRGVIFCTFDVPSTDTFVTPLEITLDYGYMESIQQQVLIRNLQT